jgi:hypothetical protein
LTINESVTSTSRTEETLSMLGAELSRTLRWNSGIKTKEVSAKETSDLKQMCSWYNEL